MKIDDLTGLRFGRLTVIRYVGGSKWECVCDCGNTKYVDGFRLKSGKTQSCGCKRKEIASGLNRNGRLISVESRSKMSESAKKRGMPEEVRLKGIRKKAESAEGGRFETNRNAKEWHLISPKGQHYHAVNMLLFIREHAELFGIDGSDEKCKYILSRFSVLKYHMKNDGKQRTCCGGWKIVLNEDDRINKYK